MPPFMFQSKQIFLLFLYSTILQLLPLLLFVLLLKLLFLFYELASEF